MSAAMANMGAMAKRSVTRRFPASKAARRMAMAGAVVCVGAVLSVADTPLRRARATTSASVEPPALLESTHAAEASGVLGRAPLIVRFDRPMAATNLAQSVTLVGPNGIEPTRVIPLGATAIIQPAAELLPASRYTLFIKGA